MKVIQIENRHRQAGGGIDVVADKTIKILKNGGIKVMQFIVSSKGLDKNLHSRFRAFGNGIYSPSSYRVMMKLIRQNEPDIIHAHNLYPLLSPSVLLACKRAGVPVVMTLHTFFLTCPTTFHSYNGSVCEKCLGGKEYWCIVKNCRNNFPESIAYAIRTAIARNFRLYKNNVTIFITPADFARSRMIYEGFKANQFEVVPNMVSVSLKAVDPAKGKYIAYAGRFSSEKGIDTLIAAAARLPKIAVKIAGTGRNFSELIKNAPKNTEFPGWLGRREVMKFYQKARFLVIPSNCLEMFPMTALEAMACGLPIIASRIGGLPEIIDDGHTGFVFEPGNYEDLANKMKLLWENPDLCKQMGSAGRAKVNYEYSEDVYLKRLMSVYKKAIQLHNN